MNPRSQEKITGRCDHGLGSFRAFTLIELLVVMAIIGILLALTVPAITGLTGSTSLSTATRNVSSFLSLARTEAIARNTVTRFAVVTDWPGESEAPYRKYSLWAWEREAINPETGEQGDYTLIRDWETLPEGIVFETAAPAYIAGSQYASKDLGTVRGDYIFEASNDRTAEFRGTPVRMRYLEFTPTGTARTDKGDLRDVMLIITEGFLESGSDGTVVHSNRSDEGTPRNWSQINTSTLTGRVHIYRP